MKNKMTLCSPKQHQLNRFCAKPLIYPCFHDVSAYKYRNKKLYLAHILLTQNQPQLVIQNLPQYSSHSNTNQLQFQKQKLSRSILTRHQAERKDEVKSLIRDRSIVCKKKRLLLNIKKIESQSTQLGDTCNFIFNRSFKRQQLSKKYQQKQKDLKKKQKKMTASNATASKRKFYNLNTKNIQFKNISIQNVEGWQHQQDENQNKQIF